LAGGVERVTGNKLARRFGSLLCSYRGGFAPPAIPPETPYDLALQLFRTDKK
jgi:hypothetical protein